MFLRLLGPMVPCIDLIPRTGLFIIPIQFYLQSWWIPRRENIKKMILSTISKTPRMVDKKGKLLQGVLVHLEPVVLLSDAPEKGRGAHLDSHRMAGV